MSTPTQVVSPRWARIDVSAPAPWLFAAAARVLHSGRSCVVLQDVLGRSLVVSGSRFGLAPGGVQVLDADLGALTALPEGSAADLSRWNPAIVVAADLALAAVPISPAAAARYRDALHCSTDRSAGPMDPSAIRAGAQEAVTRVRHGDAEGAVHALIGAGPGSTPTGDDVLVGIMAGLRAAGLPTASLDEAVLPLLPRTTSMSAHYLRAAAAGRFADRVHHLVAGLRDPIRAAQEARSAATWGATSGTDLLAGLAAGISPVPERLTA